VSPEPEREHPSLGELRVAAGRLGAAMVGAVAILVAVTAIAPATTGVLALVQILLPHMVLGTLVMAVALALALRTRAVALALGLLLLIACVRFGSEWVSLPALTSPGRSVAFLSWNLELGARAASAVAGPLLEHDADVVALQELTPDAAAALDRDARIVARYPYRLLAPDPGTFGIGILSAFPILDEEVFDAPAGTTVTLDLGSGRHLRVLNAHPLPGQIGALPRLGLPITFDGTQRDAALGRVRTRIEALLQGEDPFMVIGDYNTAPTEPGYGRLTADLRDIHTEIGFGPGWTWRPSSLESLGIGLLRIDLVLLGPGVTPLSTGVDCGKPGDHCLVDATVVVP
jgi:endonuclease/exonuclease/phosphatase family metal-dependent hydrolase